jgi:predicted RNase H-like HicB family nuclease
MKDMKLSKKAQLEIQRLRAAFPQQLAVQVARSADGGFVASVISIPGVQTEAESFSELLDMINDAIRTYFEIPAKYLAYMPTYLPSIEMAQQLDAYPVRAVEREITLVLPHGAKGGR